MSKNGPVTTDKAVRALQCLALAAVYLAAAKLSLRLAVVHPSATSVWPPSGIALAALLVWGPELWAGVALGAFAANLWLNLSLGAVSPLISVAAAAGIAAGNTLEAVVGASLVRRFARGEQAFERAQDLLKFAVLAGFLSTAVSATIGVTSLSLLGMAAWGRFGPIWLTWWLGDAMGDLLVAPLLVVWSRWPRLPRSPRGLLEAAALALCLAASGGIVFGGWLPFTKNYPIEYLMLPFLLWAALRYRRYGATASIALISVIALAGTVRGRGPFAGPDANVSLLLFQAFLGVTAVTIGALAAAISERRRAEEELGRKTIELARSNADLEQFAHVASHNLQEPLRKIVLYAQTMEQNYRGRFDDKADRALAYIVEGAVRLQRLIEDLLKYARAGAESPAPEPVRLDELIRQVLSDLETSVRESRARVSWDLLPLLRGDPVQISQLLQNLISNAIKYHGEDPPDIHIGARPDNGKWLFWVRDNGIGIEPEYQERIFTLFQRLHPGPKYPGNGIGLSISKRIVERWGGRLWVESEPLKGSTFYFTIPKGERK